MIDPNTPATELTAMKTYAQNAPQEYMIPPGGTPAMEQPEYRDGVIPLDTLPAAWWNWLLYTITEQEKRMVRFFNSIFTEFRNVLTAGGIQSFDETVTNQLVTAIQEMQRIPATTLVAGAIKAGTAYGTLAVDQQTGVATVNGAGSGQFDTLAQNITGAINEIKSALDTETNNRTSADNTLQTAVNGKAPTNHASTTTDYGVGDATNYGHVKLSDSYTETTPGTAAEGIAASQKALQDGLNSIMIIQANVPTGTVMPFAGASAPSGYLLCNGAAVNRTAYAALFSVIGTSYGSGDGSTTFNVPDLRETTPVGIGTRGSGVTRHDTYTLGQFKDDQFQQHSHNVYVKAIQDSHTHGYTTDPPKIANWSANYAAVAYSGNRFVDGQDSRSGYTDSQRPAIQVTVNSKSDFSGTDNTTTSVGTNGATHGKLIGMNYIIKY